MATWDAITDKNIDTLHPLIRPLVIECINKLALMGIFCRVTFGNRSWELQDQMYNQPWDGMDNDKDGLIDEKDEKITNAKGGDSIHNYRLALDVVEIKPMYGYSKGYPDRRWFTIKEVFVQAGFKWGGSFKSFPDKPHYEMTFGHTLKELKAIYIAQGKPQYIDFNKAG